MPAQISSEIAKHWKDTPLFAEAVSTALDERERNMAAMFDTVGDWPAYIKDKGFLNGPYIHGTNPYSYKFDNIRVLRERFPGRVAIRPPLHGPYSESCVYATPDLAPGAAVLTGQRVERGPHMATLVHSGEGYRGPQHAYADFHTWVSGGMIFSPDEPHFGAHVETIIVPEGYVLDESDDRNLISKQAFMRSVIQNAAGRIEAGTRTVDPDRDYLPPLHRRRSFEEYVASGLQPMSVDHLQALGHLTAAVRIDHLFPVR